MLFRALIVSLGYLWLTAFCLRSAVARAEFKVDVLGLVCKSFPARISSHLLNPPLLSLLFSLICLRY